jgi:hypothetical protein
MHLIKLDEFDCLVTHNAYGEYGHMHHHQVNKYVVNNYQHKPVILFGYRASGLGKMSITMTSQEIDRKMAALQCYTGERLYGHDVLPQWKILMQQFYDNHMIEFASDTYDYN